MSTPILLLTGSSTNDTLYERAGVQDILWGSRTERFVYLEIDGRTFEIY